jgi:hypothetical protein
VAEAISRTVLLELSVTYKSPSGSRETDSVVVISPDVAAPPSPAFPDAPVALPATVYISSAVIDWPHSVPEVAAISWMRLFAESAA